ncbi:hypothetical protein ACFL2Q_07820 [Thermodesulfobacteriota bacterium]
MYQEVTRDMSERERQLLRKWLDATPRVARTQAITRVLALLVGIALLTAVEIYAAAHSTSTILHCVIAVAFILQTSFCVIVVIDLIRDCFRRRSYVAFSRRTNPLIRKALDEGKVLSKKVTASSVICIDAFEDEGSAYVFEVEEGRSLLLKGQEYSYADEEDMPWPASEFEIVRSLDGEIWIRLFSTGKELEPLRCVGMENCTEEFACSWKEEVINNTPSEILESLKSERKEADRLPTASRRYRIVTELTRAAKMGGVIFLVNGILMLLAKGLIPLGVGFVLVGICLLVAGYIGGALTKSGPSTG